MQKLAVEDWMPGIDPALASTEYSNDELQNEEFLTNTIVELWSVRELYNNKHSQERNYIRHCDQCLGQLLYNVKGFVCKPGRNGGWSSWLAERKISRSTADRLVHRFAKSRGLEDKLSHDSISEEPTELEVIKLAMAAWKKVEDKLPTPHSRYVFLRSLGRHSELRMELSDDGLIVFEPSLAPAPEPEATATQAAPVADTDELVDVL